MIGGLAMYGARRSERGHRRIAGCETLDVCSTQKFACVAQSTGTATNKLGQTFAEIRSNLSTGLAAYDALDLTAFDFAPITPLVKCPAQQAES